MRKFMTTDEATRAADFKVLQISSEVVAENGSIPSKFTARGENINPPFNVQHIPQDAKTLAVVIINEKKLVHWLIWNIPITHHIRENEVHGTAGTNSFGNPRYDGPQFTGEAKIFTVKVYALKTVLDIQPGLSLHELEKTMSTEILAFGSFNFQE